MGSKGVGELKDLEHPVSRLEARLGLAWILLALAMVLLLVALLASAGALGAVGKVGYFAVLGLGLLGSALIAGFAIARVSAALLRRTPSTRLWVAFRIPLYAILLILAIPIWAVWVTGELSNPFWYVVYGVALPGAIVVSAHALMMDASIELRRSFQWQALLGVMGLVGAIGVSLLFNYALLYQLAPVAIGLAMLTIGADIAAAAWSRRKERMV